MLATRSTAAVLRRRWGGRRLTALLFAAWLALAATGRAGDGPSPAMRPLGSDGRMQMSNADRCPVCAMFSARYPQTAAAMQLGDGTTFYFCTNGCLLRAWLRPMVYLNRPPAAIDRLMVSDYFSGRPVDAREAVWVAGSDVIGPMGPAIVALGDADQLDAFKRRHGAGVVFRLPALDDALWRQISRYRLPPAQDP